MVVSLSFADLEEEKDRLSWGSRVPCMDVLRLEKPVDARKRFLRGGN